MSDVFADRQLADIALEKLSLIRAPRGYGVYASAGAKYQFAVFGRDSLEVGEDLLFADQPLCKEILLAVARLQGQKLHVANEEEPGKIHHEYRAISLNGMPISRIAKLILDYLSSRWGGDVDGLRYYGSVDSTPLFVRLVGRYVAEYGPEILEEIVIDRHGRRRPMRDHVRAAAEWVRHRVEDSSWQLLEFQRFNPKGLPYQAWKDSETGYLHTDGTRANADGGIASIEVQGYAYDALVTASNLVALDNDDAEKYRQSAQKLQSQTLKLLWMDGKQPFFAIGLDRDGTGQARQIQTYTSNSAAVLDSGLLLDLPDATRAKYVDPIVDMIMSNEFLTDVGIRTRALRHTSLINFPDYHGSLVSWPKDTYDIAKGLRRHGFEVSATKLEDCLLAATDRSSEFYEFYYIDHEGNVEYRYGSHVRTVESSGKVNVPEPSQAWTISAIISIVYARGHL